MGPSRATLVLLVVLGLVAAAPPLAAQQRESPPSWPARAVRWLLGEGAAGGPAASAPVDGEALERALHEQVDALRRSRGLGALALDARLRAVARGHSRDMSRRGYFSHRDPEGRGPGERLTEGYSEWVGSHAENIYHVGVAGALSAAERAPDALARRIVTGWMESPGHRDNLLRGDLTVGGVGVWATPRDVFVTHVMGRPVAVLERPLPTRIPPGWTWTVGLRPGPDLADAPDLEALVVWPDAARRFRLPGGRYLEGAQPVSLTRRGDVVDIPMPELREPGLYRLRIGRGGVYYDLGAFLVP